MEFGIRWVRLWASQGEMGWACCRVASVCGYWLCWWSWSFMERVVMMKMAAVLGLWVKSWWICCDDKRGVMICYVRNYEWVFFLEGGVFVWLGTFCGETVEGNGFVGQFRNLKSKREKWPDGALFGRMSNRMSWFERKVENLRPILKCVSYFVLFWNVTKTYAPFWNSLYPNYHSKQKIRGKNLSPDWNIIYFANKSADSWFYILPAFTWSLLFIFSERTHNTLHGRT